MSDHQRIYQFVFLALLIILCGCIAGRTTSSPATSPPEVASSPAPLATAGTNNTVVRVELFHFHGNQQCTSCIAVGDLAEKTVNTNFKDELASGRIVFAHVNYDFPENAVLKEKYGVTGSSLWIGVYDAKEFHKEENIKVWSLINNKDAYSTYLSGVISKRLNGDFS